jgi:hypothetical protein
VSSVKLRGAPRDGGASLLMVLFAVVFVAGIISLLVTLLDGGMRQSASLNQTQATRLAGGSALQAAESIVANTTYSSPASVPCLNGGTISYTDPSGTSFQTTCTLLAAPGSGSYSDGGFVNNHPNIGADAVVLTGTGTSLSMSGKGALNFGGNLRAYADVTYQSGGGASGPCPSLTSSLTSCGLIDLNPGMAWVAGACPWPGLFPLLPLGATTPTQPYCSGLSNTTAAMTTAFRSQINSILAQAGTQLPQLTTSGVAFPPTQTCSIDSHGNGVMYLSPGYYKSGTLLSAYTGWDYTSNTPLQIWYATGSAQAPITTCVKTSAGNTPINTVALQPGQFFFDLLDQPWRVANQESLVGGTISAVQGDTVKVKSKSTTNWHYVCKQPYDANGNYQVNGGVELVFGSSSSVSNVNGIVVGDFGGNSAGNRGVVTLCGDYSALSPRVPVVVEGLSSNLSLSLSPSGSDTLYAHSTSCNLAVSGSTCSALLSNTVGSATSAFGSLNLMGAVYAPMDSLQLTLNVDCLDTSNNPLPWMSGPFLDCELNQGNYTAPATNSGQVSMEGGIVIAGLLAQDLNSRTNGQPIAQGNANWLPAAWVPGNNGGGGLDLGFTACSPSTATCTFAAQSEAAYGSPVLSGSSVTSWGSVMVHKWLN